MSKTSTLLEILKGTPQYAKHGVPKNWRGPLPTEVEASMMPGAVATLGTLGIAWPTYLLLRHLAPGVIGKSIGGSRARRALKDIKRQPSALLKMLAAAGLPATATAATLVGLKSGEKKELPKSAGLSSFVARHPYASRYIPPFFDPLGMRLINRSIGKQMDKKLLHKLQGMPISDKLKILMANPKTRAAIIASLATASTGAGYAAGTYASKDTE